MEFPSLYELTLSLHSILRWTVLFSGMLVLIAGVLGAMSGDELGALGKRVQLGFMINVDLQVLVGMLLWVLSPVISGARGDMAASMKDPATRYFLVEHGMVMLLALVVVHVGRIFAARATEVRKVHLRTALYSGLALLLIVARMPVPFLEPARPWLRLPF
jgi:cell division protein FtsW (lipid II flippase)